MSVKVLYTTHAIATGGRNGHTRSADGIVDVDLSIPKAMGGPGKAGATTPEDLFAAGYAACFCSAVEFVARQGGLRLSSLEIRANVGIGPRDETRSIHCGSSTSCPTWARSHVHGEIRWRPDITGGGGIYTATRGGASIGLSAFDVPHTTVRRGRTATGMGFSAGRPCTSDRTPLMCSAISP